MFVDAAAGNFHLQAGSPAIDAGEQLNGFNYDKDGNFRSLFWDIGPYEYGGVPPNPPTGLIIILNKG